MKTRLLALLLVMAACAHAQEKSEAASIDATSFIELLRTDIKTQKVKLITAGLELPDDYSAKFWPVYRKYEFELDQINDEMLNLLKEYAKNYENLTSQKAGELTAKSFELQEKKLKLRKSYFEEFKKILPPKYACRYAQLDHRINLLLDLQLAGRVPLVK